MFTKVNVCLCYVSEVSFGFSFFHYRKRDREMSEETVDYLKIDPEKKNRKRPLDDISEVSRLTRAYSETMDEVQDTLPEPDLALLSPVEENIKMEIETVEVSVGKKMTRRRRFDQDRDLPEKSELSSASQTNILTTASPVNDLFEQENDDTTNQVQEMVQEVGVFAVGNSEKYETCCSKEYIMPSSDLIEQQEDPEVSYKESGKALSQVEGEVSSAELSNKGAGFINGDQERNVSPSSHDSDSKTSDFTSLCDPCSRQLPGKSVKLEDELEQAFDGPVVASLSTLGDALAEDKSEEKSTSSSVDVTEHVSSLIINKRDNLLEFSHSSLEVVPIGHPSKKLLILDINGLLADIVSPPPKEYKSDINIARRASEN